MQRWRRIIHPILSSRGAPHPRYACIIEPRSPFVVFSMRFRCRTCACCTTRPRTGLEHRRAGRPRALTYQPRVCMLCSPRLKCPRSVRVRVHPPTRAVCVQRAPPPVSLSMRFRCHTTRARTGLCVRMCRAPVRAALSTARARPAFPLAAPLSPCAAVAWSLVSPL
ncbi:hypothetical protein HYPSUDRAFT_441176 [Hypholoma sublateritium FD-334 SS-4]|uniref:Uncharacterized protein n=1 Tax=Hypholoma sublateritium (strain FD-334 SS-4) TaxID=945553 RepID=A0A0D2P9H0_HYPSF|nr:hypothetical protein HYPSUDRAFT_441176 [Hypholoma sublateritium FD-334 SS-4]